MIDFLNKDDNTSKKEKDTNFSFFLELLIFALSAIFIFISVDYFVLSPSQSSIARFYLDGFFISKFFSLLDILIIITSLHLIIYHNTHFKNASFWELILFALAFLCFILKMANPNNGSENPVLGLPLFSEINIYSFLIFFGTIISLPKETYFKFVSRIFYYSSYLVITRSVYLLILFALGQSKSFFFGIKSCLLEGDTLLLFGLFQNAFLCLYLIKKDFKYLAAWFLMLLIQILSTRRSPLFTSLFSNSIVFGFFFVRKMKPANKFITIFTLILMVWALPGIISNISPKAKVYIDRYLGVFSTDNYSTDEANSDSGHFEQSKKTTESALKMGFWGMGFGKKLIMEGAFQINGEYFVHNCYAALWGFYGVYMVIFYFLIIFIVLFHLFKLAFYNNKKYFNVSMIKIAFISFFLLYMNALYYTTLNFLTSSKFQYILFLIIVFILKLSTTNFNFLLPYCGENNETKSLKSETYINF